MSAQSNKAVIWRRLALAGPLASVFFAASLIGFAALRQDDYSHATKAVSELGAAGAPMAMAFNGLGFILPGALVVVFALSLWRLSDGGARGSLLLLALSGGSMIAAGVFPIDMADRSSMSSVLHLVGAMASGLFWAFSLYGLGKLMRHSFGARVLGHLTVWFWLFLIANVGWQIIWQTTGLVLPGWGQRIGFAGYFLWCFWAGCAAYFWPGGRMRADHQTE